ncbi:MAG: MipA/OmpV family protein [Hyphomicrobiales bacterium]|nr:MipA/OmpV family protein [Hyphomicrobiales bacterium]
MKTGRVFAAAILLLGVSADASAADMADNSRFGPFTGDWSLTVGVSTYAEPEFEGASGSHFGAVPLVSFSRRGTAMRFSSRNDNISLGLVDTGDFRAGLTGKLIFPRDSSDYHALKGLHDVDFGGELGLFAEFYPLDWMRVRGEVRKGIVTHDAIVGDLAIDAFANLTPVLQISGGPRLSAATSDYFKTYYGVNAAESLASGLSPYSPGGGLKSAGFGGALTWKTTDKVTTSLFGEYEHLLGPAADSSIVKERGSPDQFLFGVSATYRFDFSLR